MKKIVICLLHAGFWLGHITIVVIILGILYNGKEDAERINLFWDEYFWFALVPSFLSFYSFYFYLFPGYVKKKRIAGSITGAIFICLGCSVVTHLIIPQTVTDQPAGNGNVNVAMSFLIVCLIAIGNGAVALILHGFINWVNEIKWKENVMKKNHEMEMALVRSQLDPHFLFNTINNIDSLILRSPEVASEYLNRLADLMRFMFFHSISDKIPLKEEVDYMHKYVALQKLRKVTEKYATVSVLGDTRGKDLAPMVLIPFVENAFKHAPGNEEEKEIQIVLEIFEDRLTFTCTNKYCLKANNMESFGIGNDLIEKRLQLLYPHSHELNIRKDNGRYSVSLLIIFKPLIENKHQQ